MKYSHIIALIFWASLTGTMVVEVGLELPWAQSSGFAGLSTVMIAVLAFGWVLTHSRENDVQVPGALKIGVILLAAVAVPYYKFKYFGARSGLLFVGILVFCFMLAFFLSDAITALILSNYNKFE